jgi:DNA-binding beta-propeller fold protein YncE
MRVAKTIAAWFVASGLTFVLVPSDSPIAVVGPAAAQEARAAPPQLSFKLVENFLKLPPNIYMAEVVGVTLDSKGQIYVLHRGKQPILEFNPDGSFVRSIGEGLPFEGPHAVRVDPQDNLWYIDAGSNLVVKFDQQKRVQMVLGRRPEPWTWATHVIERAIPGPANFYQPTDVTWGPDGSIYVADGYGNSRIAKFNKDGNLIKHWGERGTQAGEFNTPHSIVIDAQSNLYVADRQNGRIQVFDTDGKFKQEWRVGGNPWSLCLTPGPHPVMYVGSVGRVIKVSLDGKVQGTMGKFGRVPGMFDWVHGIACPDEHTIYAAQELSFRLDKLAVE